MLAFFAPRAIPGVEAVDEESYRRSIIVNGHPGSLQVSLSESKEELEVRVRIGEPHSLYAIVERVRKMFDVNADWAAIAHGLKGDPELARRISVRPGLRVPGCWDGFELAVRAVLGQQISVKGASTLAGRIARAFGKPIESSEGLTHLFPSPEVLADARANGLGLTHKRAETIRSLARRVCDGKISFERVLDGESFRMQLREVPGIGEWTAHYIAMRALGDPDALPAADLGLLHALNIKSPRQLAERAEAWRPWRSYATMYLWAGLCE
jgi:AraC family transcriptional regulator of adaptative response / DNA-3-methyladenine glycosylase II